jgi:ABC-2 type transport system ATP-binding protein
VSAPVIRVEWLRFYYGEGLVLDGLDVAVGQGEVFGVVGADGAGKSTLLRLMIGQLKPAAGRVSILGMDAADPRLRNHIAYMPQGFGQYMDLSIRENLEFFADLHGLERGTAQSLIADLLARTGLAGFENRRAGQLSGGMMQKLALACALVSRPQAMFLDEPTTGVDPVSRRAFWQLLDGVRAEGVAIVYATANMDEAERCDRVGLLEHGRFAREGAPLALMAGAAGRLLGVSGIGVRGIRSKLRELPGVEMVFPVGHLLKIWVGDEQSDAMLRDSIGALASHLQVDALQPTLQDVALRDLALAGARGHD